MSAKERREHFGETYDPDTNPDVRIESMETIGEIDIPGVEILDRDISDLPGEAWLVKFENRLPFDNGKSSTHYFIVSGVTSPFEGWTCEAFPAFVNGTPITHDPVAGRYGMSHRGVIEELADKMKYNHE